MSVRIYVSSPVQLVSGAWVAKAEQYMTGGHVSWIPSLESGAPASNWVLSMGVAPNWTAAIADADLRQVFPIPAGTNTRAALRAYLTGTTLSQATPAQQASLTALIDSLGVYRGDVTGAWTLGRILRRLVAALMEKDPSYGDVWGGTP